MFYISYALRAVLARMRTRIGRMPNDEIGNRPRPQRGVWTDWNGTASTGKHPDRRRMRRPNDHSGVRLPNRESLDFAANCAAYARKPITDADSGTELCARYHVMRDLSARYDLPPQPS